MVKLEFGPGPCKWDLKGKRNVDEIHSTYMLHYMKPDERSAFVHAAYGALKKGGQLIVLIPHWCSHKAYADPRVQWPPVAEGWFSLLNEGQRKASGLKLPYKTDFDVVIGYAMHPAIATRNSDYQQTAMSFWKEAAQDMHVTMTKR